MSMPAPPDHRKEVRLAAAALHAALSNKWDVARRYMIRIGLPRGYLFMGRG